VIADRAPLPILLYNGECAVCVRVADWVRASERDAPVLDLRPIGDDPEALEQLHPGLDIWDAYEIVHLLMPDGSMKTGGAAVVDVFRLLPNTKWSSRLFDLHLGTIRPAAWLVDVGYTTLAEIRPLLGCASCGSTNTFVRTVHATLDHVSKTFRNDRRAIAPYFHTASWRAARTNAGAPNQPG